MSLFQELINHSADSKSLELFIHANSARFYELLDSHYSVLLDEKNDIREFIESKGELLEELDYSSSQIKGFISVLFDFCERFGFLCTIRIQNTLRKKELYLGKRREAAKLFLLGVKNNKEYLRRFENIINLLQCAFETEEEDEKKGIVTFVNFYAKVIQDVEDDSFVEGFRNLTNEYTGTYPFLSHSLIQDVFFLDIEQREKTYDAIQELIEAFLEHPFEEVAKLLPDILYIEDGTLYAEIIRETSISFHLIRKIAVSNFKRNPVELQGRGVQPLQEEDELYSYLYRYGPMHKAKLDSALEFLPIEELSGSIEVFDWGCGQGLASVVLYDYIKQVDLSGRIKRYTLIEPSELSLRRAALHVNCACPDAEIRTYCLGFDMLTTDNISTEDDSIKVHLFSNVLDLSGIFFSQNQLIETIENSCRGRNYFVIASPYSDDIKADQIDAFKRYFVKNYATTTVYCDISNSKSSSGIYWNCNNNYKSGKCLTHSGNGCDSRWSRIVKVFSVTL